MSLENYEFFSLYLLCRKAGLQYKSMARNKTLIGTKAFIVQCKKPVKKHNKLLYENEKFINKWFIVVYDRSQRLSVSSVSPYSFGVHELIARVPNPP